MPISCGHCGASHDTLGQVRACSQPQDHTVGPGPQALGRNVVVAPGQPTPSAWLDAPRVVIDHTVVEQPDAVVTQLRQWAHRRERSVFELVVELEGPCHEVDRRPTHVVGARTRLLRDELHHLVWSNSIDARGDTPRFALVDAAVALGARPGGPADVILPDDSPAWLDGGPLQFCSEVDGARVVPAVSVEHGRLTAFASNDLPDGIVAPDQQAAVTHTGGAARIIAPAGSGKTRVLTERARHVVTRWGLPASAVTLLAYNRRAHDEMSDRTRDVPGLQIRTLNGIALAIVNGTRPYATQPRMWRTIDEREVRRILGDLVDLPARRNQDPLAPWIEALRAIRLELLAPALVEARFNGDVDGLSEVWPRFAARLDAQGIIDFDHQLHMALWLVLTDPVVRRAAQRANRVLLVDEFQDLTPAHVLLLRLLAAPGGAVFGVGDDDQTIYGYQGADPGWLIDFAQLFPGAGDHPLQVNYRCPEDVVTAAGTLLAHNSRRVSKVLRAHTSSRATGLVVTQVGSRPAATVEATVQALVEARDAGIPPSDMAVLTRVNSLLAPVQVALALQSIPVQGGPGTQLLTRTAVRAVLAWLRLGRPTAALDPRDLAEALRRPSRSLHPNVTTWVGEQRSLDGLERLADRVRTDRDAERVRAFAADITRVARRYADGASTSDLVRLVVHDLGVSAAVSTLDRHRRGSNAVAQNDDLLALEQLAEHCADPSTFDQWLNRMLAVPDDANGVQLATVHRVKGQEWPVVVVHQADDDQFPHRLADDVEEERRVFHVAITRTSRQVVVVSGASPSPFIAEMQGRAVPAPKPRTVVEKRAPVAASNTAGLVDTSTVMAAVGLSLVDSGTWTVTEIHDDGVVITQDRVHRRLAFGANVVTAGRQRGRLIAATEVSPPSVRAYDLLRQLRERLRGDKPAYIVFNDATLERIALALPRNAQELSVINGIGPAKLELYGEAVLLAVEDADSVVGGTT